MPVIALANGEAAARISTQGGALLNVSVAGVPLLRPAPDNAAAIDSACYPLVPFGNRVRGNRFVFGGRVYTLEPNTQWDLHYLHGEGWLSDWQVDEQSVDHLVLSHRHADPGMPYVYAARQEMRLHADGIALSLTVVNEGAETMPFGIGWHPYFPMTPLTTLETGAQRMWSEEPGWLPGKPGPVPRELDFAEPRPLPGHWVNNAFEAWSGSAVVRWPERRSLVRIEADPLFTTMFLFVSDTAFDASYRRDFFALEPMSHLPDGHNLSDLGGLKPLRPGEALSGTMRLTLERL
ncbi:MAG: aldose 1-epimerase [Rhizobiaceae bacterium]|nr:aldose 1-epimerase [Rhizobiaceae bacterium]